MNTLEIIDYLKEFKNFCGVFPRDRLPNKLNLNCAIIVNTDKASESGEHWVSIFNGEKGVIYFDSFGLPPLHKEIFDFLNIISNDGWYYNSITFQSVYQDTCGMYCLFFITCMLRHNDFNVFRVIFKCKTDFNDILAKIIYKVQK